MPTTDLAEHSGTLLAVIAILGLMLGYCIKYMIDGLKEEMRQDRAQREKSLSEFATKVDKVESYLEQLTNELFDRMRKAESSLGKLWTEHRMIKEMGGHCKNHQLTEDEEHSCQ